MIKSLANSSITNQKKYRSMMAGSVENNADHFITETILNSSVSSVTLDVSSLAALGYTNLQIRAVTRTDRAAADAGDAHMRFNGDTGANYSAHQVYGDGSTAGSAAYSSQSFMYCTSPLGPNNPSTSFTASIHDILEFANTSKYKSMRSLSGGAGYGAGHHAPITMWGGSWRSTAAITSITITCAYGANFVANSRFTVYASKG